MGRIGKIHFICLALALLDLFVFLQWRISFRGQWLNILLSLAPFVTGLYIFFNRFRRLQLAGKIYFTAMPFLNALLAPLYFLATTCIPLTTITERKNYEARGVPGMLSNHGANLIRKNFIFEKIVSGKYRL